MPRMAAAPPPTTSPRSPSSPPPPPPAESFFLRSPSPPPSSISLLLPSSSLPVLPRPSAAVSFVEPTDSDPASVLLFPSFYSTLPFSSSFIASSIHPSIPSPTLSPTLSPSPTPTPSPAQLLPDNPVVVSPPLRSPPPSPLHPRSPPADPTPAPVSHSHSPSFLPHSLHNIYPYSSFSPDELRSRQDNNTCPTLLGNTSKPSSFLPELGSRPLGPSLQPSFASRDAFLSPRKAPPRPLYPTPSKAVSSGLTSPPLSPPVIIPAPLPTPPSSGKLHIPASPPSTPGRPPRYPSLSGAPPQSSPLPTSESLLSAPVQHPHPQHPHLRRLSSVSPTSSSPIDPTMQQYNYHHGYHTNPHPSPPSSQEVQTSLDGLPRRLESSLTLQSPSTSPPTQYTPVYPSRQQSQHYQSLNAHVHASQQLDLPKTHYGLTEEEYEELEDRRRMKQQILRDKLEQAEYNKRSPDPNMSVKMTTSTGFALGTFDMTESLAIVDDILDYFGDDNLENEEFDHAERFNETQLIEAEKTHLQRESLVRHLYDSEEDYLRSLQDIQTCYQRPMLLSLQNIDTKKSGLLSSSGPKPVASNQEIETLFGNLDQLIEFHEEIRAQLDNRSKIWGPTQIMSDLLINVIPKFKLYSKYFTNFHAALTVLDRISRTVQYKKFMEQCVVDNPPGTASLHLMLAFPLKRLSTYRDLIAAICKATQSNHPDYYNLMRALDMTNLVSNELRPERVMAEDQLTLWDVQSSMVGLPEPIMIPARRLLLRADLHKVDSTLALEPRTYYLMNDVLLYARFDPKKNVYTFKGMFDLARSQVNNPEDNLTLPQLPNCIQIANSGRKQMMRCRSREERNFWMETMRQAVDIVNRSLEDTNGVVSAANGETLPMRRYANSIASDSSSSLGHTTMASGSAMGGSKSYTDSRSINSKSSSDGNSKSSKPRKPNPQTDFYGCSFGTNHEKDNTEDNYKPRTLGHSMASNSSASSVSTGATGTTTTIQNAGTTNHQSLGAMLAAIPESKLTPKQVKEKAALAAAVEARRQARLKKEAKSGGATATATARGENSRNVNFDFSSSFIPAKDRIAKQHNDH